MKTTTATKLGKISKFPMQKQINSQQKQKKNENSIKFFIIKQLIKILKK